MKLNDTIVALSTPPGRSGVGVVRLSGLEAARIATTFIALQGDLRPWGATLGQLLDDDGEIVDEVVVTHFAAPRSYTAEQVVEISCHGSPVVLRHCLERAVRAGARLAEPGEFTLRAFLNGRIDLPQAEGVHDLIQATTLYQARIAAQQTQGSVSRRLAPVKSQLVELIALLEAGIDFAEDDVSVAPAAEIARRLDPILAEVRALIDSFRYGNLIRCGFSMAIVGRPNAGKSSLFNRLLNQERAIVTEVPGTTRDLVAETMEFAGIPVRLVDTAGIRKNAERIEQLGIERSFEAMADADLVLVVVDGTAERTPEDESLIAQARSNGAFLVVANKCDLAGFRTAPGELAVSARTGRGIDELRKSVPAVLSPEGLREAGSGFITSVRHEGLLRESLSFLEKTAAAARHAIAHEFLLLDLYCALAPLDAITGVTTADDILNRIFAKFCIGK